MLALDMAVWDLRRYCQVLSVFGKKLPATEESRLESAKAKLKLSADRPAHEFRLGSGFLEDVLGEKDHPARDALIWQNAFFGVKNRKKVRVKDFLHASNSPLYLYPDMLQHLLNYVYIPAELRAGYRQHLQTILEDPAKRP